MVEPFNQTWVALRITLRSRGHGATTDLELGVDAYVGLAAGFGGPRFLSSDLGNLLGSMSVLTPLMHKSGKLKGEWQPT